LVPIGASLELSMGGSAHLRRNGTFDFNTLVTAFGASPGTRYSRKPAPGRGFSVFRPRRAVRPRGCAPPHEWQCVVCVRRRNGRMAHSHRDLVQSTDHVADGVQAFEPRLLVAVDDDL